MGLDDFCSVTVTGNVSNTIFGFLFLKAELFMVSDYPIYHSKHKNFVIQTISR